jgi:hypothetical protein
MFVSPFMIPIAIVALSIGGWVITTWIRAKHGYPLDDGAGGKIEPRGANSEEVRLLREENSRLTDLLENYSDRLAVLERIVTDKGYDVAEQIERLRADDVRIEDQRDEQRS